MLIQSPIAWIGDRLDRALHTVGSASDEDHWRETHQAGVVTVRRIGMGDIRQRWPAASPTSPPIART
jgi:hypothetical protein